MLGEALWLPSAGHAIAGLLKALSCGTHLGNNVAYRLQGMFRAGFGLPAAPYTVAPPYIAFTAGIFR